jgi:hypothetical protein
MILTKNNLQEWKAELNQKMLPYYPNDKYSETVDDKDWLDMYEGFDTDEAVYEELTADNN